MGNESKHARGRMHSTSEGQAAPHAVTVAKSASRSHWMSFIFHVSTQCRCKCRNIENRGSMLFTALINV